MRSIGVSGRAARAAVWVASRLRLFSRPVLSPPAGPSRLSLLPPLLLSLFLPLLLSSLFLVAAPARTLAFAVPAGGAVDAGSEWRYHSNLGSTLVRMLEREELEPGVERYVWEMRVAGFTFRESLVLTTDALGVSTREFSGFGLIVERFHFDTPELVMELPLRVGNEWSWSGSVTLRDSTATGHAEGEVVRVEEVTVPAGTFQTYLIRLTRRDEFGTRQEIDLWFDPDVGPIRAVGDLHWRGLIGAVQRLVGFTRFEVELVSYAIQSRFDREGEGEAGFPSEVADEAADPSDAMHPAESEW